MSEITYPTNETDSATTTPHQQTGIIMYTTSWCGDCRRSKKVFAALGVPYTEVDIEQHPEAAEIVRRVNHGAQSVPTIVFPDGSILVEPSNAVLETKLKPFVVR